MTLYASATSRLAVLDTRGTGYQFQFEDVPFEGAAGPGAFFSTRFLEDIAVDVRVLDEVPERRALFEWALALAHCEAFRVQEELIGWFAADQASELGPSRSVRLLVEEEEKHARAFARFGGVLAAARPEHRATFQAAFAESAGRFGRKMGLELFKSPANRHCMFWTLVLFFEEYTVWVEQRLADANLVAQPAWRELHRLHRIEELQHLATDSALLAALELTDEERAGHARALLATLAAGFWHYVPVHPARAVVEAAFPGTKMVPLSSMARSGFWREIRQAPTFKRTREILSVLDPREVPPIPPPPSDVHRAPDRSGRIT